MDASINKNLSHLERTILPLLGNSVKDPTIRYNNICKTYFSDKFLGAAGISGGVGALLLTVPNFTLPSLGAVSTTLPAVAGGSTAVATTSTALTASSLPSWYTVTAEGIEVLDAGIAELAAGEVVTSTEVAATSAAAGGAGILSSVLPVIAAAIGGFLVGKAIGDLILDDIVLPKKGKEELEKLKGDINKLKSCCNSMSAQLNLSMSSLRAAMTKIDKAAAKLNGLEYATKQDNLKRLKSRKEEIATAYRDVAALKGVISNISAGISRIA